MVVYDKHALRCEFVALLTITRMVRIVFPERPEVWPLVLAAYPRQTKYREVQGIHN
jgi:hypothetical protein